jgi:2,4-dienoyl-CoA reductase-like NADH-dependent reductase (Old Yellow Enzyme family)
VIRKKWRKDMKVFEPAEINGMKLANRFVRSATWEAMATTDSYCTPELAQLLVRLAEGGVGLIITSHSTVSPEGQAGIKQVGIWDDIFIPKLAEMTAAVHQAGGKIVMQINHSGPRADSAITNEAPIGPMFQENEDGTFCKEMTRLDIRRIAAAFGAAALRAKQAGFDGAEVHAAHGYLLSSFLSPYFNKRRDEYGGTIENRARFLLEVLQSIFAAVGDDFPIIVKMNAADFLPGGFSAQDMVQTAALLEEAGVDAIELSGGTAFSEKCIPSRRGRLSPEEEGYYKEEAKKYKERIAVPLILVGGFRSLATSEKFLQEGICDFIAISRPLIREPELINRWKSGDTSPSTCISDNMCYRPLREGKGLYCLTERREKEGK